jgi:hypothetical protein
MEKFAKGRDDEEKEARMMRKGAVKVAVVVTKPTKGGSKGKHK